eukprot:1159476-Pelagomonas_calceolata.AAC.6
MEQLGFACLHAWKNAGILLQSPCESQHSCPCPCLKRKSYAIGVSPQLEALMMEWGHHEREPWF